MFLGISNLARGRLDLSITEHLSQEDFSRWTRRIMPRAGDVVFSYETRLGEAALVPAGLRCCLGRRMGLLRPRLDRVDPRFLLYTYLGPRFQETLRSRTIHGSTVDRIPLIEMGSFPIEISQDIAEQRAIAHILGTLDDKIELNRRMNETLEAMARALFKSWFADFDPVRAKAEGCDPALPKPLADLFPDAFEDSALGQIPKGWGVRGLDEIARFLNGLALQKYPATDGRALPVIKIAQVRAGTSEGADAACADLDPEYIVDDGDVLFSWSGSLECVLWSGGRGALNQHLFKVTSTEYPKWLCYLGIHQHLADFRHIAAGKATTMGHIQRHHLSDARLAIPSSPLLKVIDSTMAPLIEALWRRRVESRTLAALRDTLLPKLISGEIRVKDAEHFPRRCA
ncbi:MAG TPA: restriction endonuclease subunit S [Thermoleophilia bacterium]|nr:restriction endonuclease subunit S [Thermoleophilia bacterium]